jgi:hypothetical protein
LNGPARHRQAPAATTDGVSARIENSQRQPALPAKPVQQMPRRVSFSEPSFKQMSGLAFTGNFRYTPRAAAPVSTGPRWLARASAGGGSMTVCP